MHHMRVSETGVFGKSISRGATPSIMTMRSAKLLLQQYWWLFLADLFSSFVLDARSTQIAFCTEEALLGLFLSNQGVPKHLEVCGTTLALRAKLGISLVNGVLILKGLVVVVLKATRNGRWRLQDRV